MWRVIPLGTLLMFTVWVGTCAVPSPQELRTALLARYQELSSFFAEVEEIFAFGSQTVFTSKKVWFSAPRVRIERVGQDEEMGYPLLEIHDAAQRKSWYLLEARIWEEAETRGLPEPLSLWALGLGYLPEFVPEEAVEEVLDGEVLLVLRGRLGKMKLTLWIEPETLFIRQAVRGVGNLTWTYVVKEFQTGVEVAESLFQPPSPQEIARIFKLSLEGMEIARKVGQRYSGLQSFFARKRILEDRMVIGEEWIYWQRPFLRIEHRTPPSPWFPSEVTMVELVDLAEGALYTYFAEENGWERDELPGEYTEEFIDEIVLAAAFGFFPEHPIVEVAEETLGQRPVWRLTGRGLGKDAPLPQWWIDKETLQIVQYTEPFKLLGLEKWKVQTVQIIHFEENVEVPAELLAKPTKISPAKREAFPPVELPPSVSEEMLHPTAGALDWTPFSWEELDEAVRTAGAAVVYFGADWCEPCHVLEEEAFRAPAIVELLAPLPRFKVDLTKFSDPLGREVQSFYNVRVVPTLLFLGPDGNEIGRVSGYSSAAHLYLEIKRIMTEVER